MPNGGLIFPVDLPEIALNLFLWTILQLVAHKFNKNIDLQMDVFLSFDLAKSKKLKIKLKIFFRYFLKLVDMLYNNMMSTLFLFKSQ